MPSGAKAVERPRILSNIVAQDVVVPISGAHSEIGRVRRVPLPIQIFDFVFVAVENKSKRPLIGAMARIALDSHFSHQILCPKDLRSLRIDCAIEAGDFKLLAPISSTPYDALAAILVPRRCRQLLLARRS